MIRSDLMSGVAGYERREGSASRSRVGVLSSQLSLSPSLHTVASEKDAALAAVPSDAPTIFDKIIKKEIPATVVYENDKAVAFRDINPQAPTHILIIPKARDGLTGLSKAEERHVEILGHLLYIANVVSKQEGLDDGYRIVINDGPNGCQSVYHLHIHLLVISDWSLDVEHEKMLPFIDCDVTEAKAGLALIDSINKGHVLKA